MKKIICITLILLMIGCSTNSNIPKDLKKIEHIVISHNLYVDCKYGIMAIVEEGVENYSLYSIIGLVSRENIGIKDLPAPWFSVNGKRILPKNSGGVLRPFYLRYTDQYAGRFCRHNF